MLTDQPPALDQHLDQQLDSKVDSKVDSPLDPISGPGDHDELVVAGRFEPCPAYRAPHDGAPGCADCGWLDEEHGVARPLGGGVVRTLARRRPPTRRPRRLAS